MKPESTNHQAHKALNTYFIHFLFNFISVLYTFPNRTINFFEKSSKIDSIFLAAKIQVFAVDFVICTNFTFFAVLDKNYKKDHQIHMTFEFVCHPTMAGVGKFCPKTGT